MALRAKKQKRGFVRKVAFAANFASANLSTLCAKRRLQDEFSLLRTEVGRETAAKAERSEFLDKAQKNKAL